MAELVQPPTAEKAQRRFGTGKGKAMLIDPRALNAMTDALRLYGLPRHHSDPFDRMLIATALAEAIPLIGSSV